MTAELSILALVMVLALIQILLPAAGRTAKFGLKWNAGARDIPQGDPGPITGRLERAQANLFETLPLFIGVVLTAHVVGVQNDLTLWGSILYLVARVVYVPLYALGVPYVRSLVWGASLAGLILILIAVLTAQ